MRLLYYILLIILVAATAIEAQQDTPLVKLPLIEVKDAKVSITKDLIFDSQTGQNELLLLEHDVQDLLQLFSTAYLRDYGNKTLGTISIRGSSSQQSVVLWNGADIGNPMLGQSDISLLPAPFFNEIALNSTQANTAYNPIGGSLHLNTGLSDSSGYALGFKAGQFDHYSGFFKGQIKLHPHLGIGMRAIKVSDLQNFTYQEEHASVLLPEQQPHALHQQNGFLGTASYTPNDKHSFEASTWLQSLTREIPPLRTQRISEAIQFDTLIRSQFEWSADWNIYQHKILVTLRDESNAYRDPRNGIDANNQFAAQQILSQHQLHFSEKFQTHFGLNANWIQVSTPNYQNAKTSLSRYQVYFKPVYQLKNIPLQFEGAIRYNQDRDSIAPFTGHIKAFWKDEYHHFSLELTRAHRFPSFNDLFWEPAGNPDLKPENSQQLNFGYQFLHTSSNKQVKLQCNLFYKNIDNWILWAPIDQFLWSPSNILEVTSMGIDLNQSFSYRISEEQAFSIQLNGLYQSVRNTGPINTPRAQKGENLIYMPEFKLSGSLRWEYQNFTAMYIHNWRSKIYTSPDLSEYLDALNIGQFRLSYEINVLQQEIQVFVRAHNLWNTSYYYQPNLPAPGVRWRAGFLIQKR